MRLIKEIRNKIKLKRIANKLTDMILDEDYSDEEIRKGIEHSKDVIDELKTE